MQVFYGTCIGALAGGVIAPSYLHVAALDSRTKQNYDRTSPVLEAQSWKTSCLVS